MHQFFIFFQDDTAILSTRIRKPDVPVVSDESGAGEVVQFRVCNTGQVRKPDRFQ